VINERPHKKLDVWKKSIDLVTLIYEIAKSLPREEDYGLKSQMRRAAVSVPSNIAEGLTRRTVGDKLHFLNMAQGSLSELDTQVELCLRLNYIDEPMYDKVENYLIEIQKMLSGLNKSLRKL
jgi:four helix bundle protein